jgi:hypothetical protein
MCDGRPTGLLVGGSPEHHPAKWILPGPDNTILHSSYTSGPNWPIIMTEQLFSTARRVNWYIKPESLLADHNRFLCEVMARGSASDVQNAKSAFSNEAFREAYKDSPPGLFDRRSWAYWGLMLFFNPDYLPYPERFTSAETFDWRS